VSTSTLLTDNYSYNATSQLSQVSNDNSTSSFAYLPISGQMGTLTTAMSGDDLVTTSQYDALTGHLTQVKTMRGTTLIEEDDYSYFGAGDANMGQISMKQVTRRLSDNSTEAYYETYTYDALNQLTSDIRYSVLVPIQNGYAVYEVKSNGTAILRTIIER
jgi:hypothetical protein